MNRPNRLQSSAGHERLLFKGGLLAVGILALGALAGLSHRVRAADGVLGSPDYSADIRQVWDSVRTLEGQVAVTNLALERAENVMGYSATHQIPADLAAAIYDIALSEGINPAIGFRLVAVESSFDPRARSQVGAIGYTQMMLATARFYVPDIDEAGLYDRDTNLRLGFRFLKDLLDRFDNNLTYALLAYNRGPVTVRNLLAQGQNPANGYAQKVMQGR